MSQFVITAPDGKKYRITAPDDATQEQVLAYAQQNFAPQKSMKERNPAEYDPISSEYQAKYGPASGGTAENLGAGAGKFFSDIGLGLKERGAEALDAIAPRHQNLSDLVTGHDPSRAAAVRARVEEDRRTAAPLMATKAGKVGYIGGGLAATAPLLALPGANTVVSAALTGGALGAAQPTVEGESVVRNAALGAGLGAAGQKFGTVVGNYATRKIAERSAAKAAEQSVNSVRDAALREATQAGYVIPPSHGNPTAGNRMLESVSGKAATQQSATIRNQRVTNRLIREELSLRKDAPISVKTLENIRTIAGSVYRDVKASGNVITDGQYLDELAELSQSADEIAKDFPDLNFAGSKEIQELQSGLTQERFSANGAVEAIKQLRKQASGNLSWKVEDPAKKALGLAQREAAGIVEDQLIRHLRAVGKDKLAGQFDKARTTIAKTYSVQSALNDSTGNVIATKLAAQLRKGKPLSGGLERAARFAEAFPKAAGEQLSSPGVSGLDAIIGLGGGVTVSPSLLAVPAARIAARGAVLSGPYQRAFTLPKYLPKTKLLRGLGAGSEFAPAAGVLIPGYVEQEQAF